MVRYTSVEAVRRELRIKNVSELTDAEVLQWIDDSASRVTNTTDELAHRYFTCYLVARSLTQNQLNKMGDVSWTGFQPGAFFEQYKERCKELGVAVVTADKPRVAKANADITDPDRTWTEY